MIKQPSTHYDCAIIGDWHLAFVTSAALASLGHKVILLHPGNRDETWDSCPLLDLDEPMVNETIHRYIENGSFSYGNYQEDDWQADYVWLAIDTHVREDDTCDTSSIENVLNYNLREKIKKSLVITSQVPLGFCRKYLNRYPIVYIPENLQLGNGLNSFLKSERLVIGSEDKILRDHLKKLLKEVQGEVIECDLNTAEMIKHATNIFLATSISLANQLAMIGEKLNVDNRLVGKALKADPRIGPKAYVTPGTGFAGGTLPRDLKIIQALGKELNVPTALIDSVLEINDSTNLIIVQTLNEIFASLKNKNVLLLGYSYKKDIDTLRRSPAITLAKLLKKEGAKVYGFDPIMNDKNLKELDDLIEHKTEITPLFENLDAIIITTPRDQFKELNWCSLLPADSNGLPLFLFDLNGILDFRMFRNKNIIYKNLWQAHILPTKAKENNEA